MSYNKPDGLLKDIQQKRLTPKSSFLRKLEKQQAEARQRETAIVQEQQRKVRALPKRGVQS